MCSFAVLKTSLIKSLYEFFLLLQQIWNLNLTWVEYYTMVQLLKDNSSFLHHSVFFALMLTFQGHNEHNLMQQHI